MLKSSILISSILLVAASVAAQSRVTQADLQRLQDAAYDASRDVAQLRARDSELASRLQNELDDARDEVIYLRVKLRKNEPVTQTDYADLRDRIDDIRNRASGVAQPTVPPAPPAPAPPPVSAAPPPPPAPPAPAERPSRSTSSRTSSVNDVPVGTEFDVRLQNSLSSRTAQTEDRFEATTLVDLREGDRVLVPSGSTVRGVVSSVTKATRLERKGALRLTFDQMTIGGTVYPLRATVTDAIESEGIRGETGRIGAAAGVGAIIGGILGGVRGALAGILIGGGGMVAATEGKDVDLPAGAILRVRLDTPLMLR
jgi:hypothetical protein